MTAPRLSDLHDTARLNALYARHAETQRAWAGRVQKRGVWARVREMVRG